MSPHSHDDQQDDANTVDDKGGEEVGQRQGISVAKHRGVAIASVEEDGVIVEALTQDKVDDVAVPQDARINTTGAQTQLDGRTGIGASLQIWNIDHCRFRGDNKGTG